MSLFKNKERKKIQWKIKQDCLDLIFECAKSSYPNEFGGLLRVDDTKKDTITEIVILPGTVSGESHAIFQMHMRPIDFSIVGTVHSHPSSIPKPSSADIQLFGKYGSVHIIAAYPYTLDAWEAFDYEGNSIIIDLVQ